MTKIKIEEVFHEKMLSMPGLCQCAGSVMVYLVLNKVRWLGFVPVLLLRSEFRTY